MEGERFIQVIVPLRLGWMPTYRISEDVHVGQRVRVRVARGSYVGVVRAVGVEPDVAPLRILPVESADTGLPDITLREIQLWEFIASYYLCTVGEVYKAAYPSMKVKSEETAANAAQAKEERRLATAKRLQGSVERRIARLEASLALREKALSGHHGKSVTARLELERDRMMAELESARLSLEELSVVEMPARPSMKRVPSEPAPAPKPLLLRGAGRTGEYVRMTLETLASGRDVLILVPDIVFCDRMEAALLPDIPDLLVFNSQHTQARRRRIASALRNSDVPCVVLGTRSALFLPFCDLGLVIVDDEQDMYYKQTEPAPRYNGRDAAIKLASIHGAKSVLGSSLPSLESEYNCLSGKYVSVTVDGPEPAAGCFPSPTMGRSSSPAAGRPSSQAMGHSSSPDLCHSSSQAAGHSSSRTLGHSASPATGLAEGLSRTVIVDIPAEKRKRGMLGDLSRIMLREISEFDGSVTVIRTWEKEDAVREQLEKYLPGREIAVRTMAEARRSGFGDMVVILQADALVDRNDFRADERAAQLVAQLRSMTGVLIIQTAVPSRWDGSRSMADLLAERREFSFPPYTRLVNVTGPSGVRQFFLPRDRSLTGRKTEIAAAALRDETVDVDPV